MAADGATTKGGAPQDAIGALLDAVEHPAVPKPDPEVATAA